MSLRAQVRRTQGLRNCFRCESREGRRRSSVEARLVRVIRSAVLRADLLSVIAPVGHVPREKQMIKVLGAIVAALTIVGVLITGATVFYACLFLAVNPTPWNFPGDPPLFDLLIYAGAITAMVNLPLAFLVKRLAGQSRRLLGSIPRLCAIVGVVMFVGAAAGILERQDARWAAVRNGIRQYGDAVATASADKHRVLSHEEFEQFKKQFMPRSVPVLLPGYGMVQLRMAHGVYPYVGVDFTDASHALFDPTTMLCTYSD